MPAIDQYLTFMIEENASDFHLCSGVDPIFRLDGDIVHLEGKVVIEPEQVQALIEEIMPEENKAEFGECFDTDFAYEISGLARFRVNVFMDQRGMGAVIRQIPAKILSADDLGLPESVRKFCELTKGLVVVTGPTGSGKSTTLAAMIDLINETRADHIITIEDPVEFVHPNKSCLVNHREVHRHTMSFRRALRAALREDPDIVLVGEMRDLETVEIAIETAETGHLVFGTLHTTTAASTVDRIIDQFPGQRQAQIRTMLSESLKGVVAQVLCKRIGGGRAAAMEILVGTSAISNLIREGKLHQIPSIMQTGQKFGMQLLNDALLRLVEDDIIEPREAYLKAVDKESLEPRLRAAGFDV
ncbi:MAG: type IV pilus twitching motility protein PilT [Lentisphaerae bacterium]|jgi:twitching motility protein PilT|nr:type IV pilus twitching motility protein PilT [Lentisphaerota bacterium]MBT5611453.1 type IV pilus twitching motility protein PilT [Lentisphaerota bacterium]MBT7846910.1 type IV pilus twitching motility protein PilT [Lentisphaerota bacterium]